jgi:hypothetical protein
MMVDIEKIDIIKQDRLSDNQKDSRYDSKYNYDDDRVSRYSLSAPSLKMNSLPLSQSQE